jgi:hypothetical protein
VDGGSDEADESSNEAAVKRGSRRRRPNAIGCFLGFKCVLGKFTTCHWHELGARRSPFELVIEFMMNSFTLPTPKISVGVLEGRP